MNSKRLKVGIYDPYLCELGGGERYVAIFAETLQDHYDVELMSHDSTSIYEIEKRFTLDLGNVKKRELPPKTGEKRTTNRRGWVRNLLEHRAEDRKDAQFTSEYDLFINLSNSIPNYSFARNSILLLQMPYFDTSDDRLGDRTSLRERVRHRLFGASLTMEEVLKLKCYQKKIANSHFTRKWIHRLWNVDCEVVYTGLDTSLFQPAPKENIILSVGRFQPDLFCKNQHILVEVFKELCEEGLMGWELHMAGGVAEKPGQSEYFLRVKKAAEGYPIIFHPNAAFDELRDLYSRSRMFWHATGLTEDEVKTPWRMEHFGLTTVEAMSAGCVPVVINKGGQPEIVTNETDGFLWNTVDELKSRTMSLAEGTELETKLRLRAMDRSHDFEKSLFQRNIRAIVGSLQHSYEEAFV